MNCTVYRDWIIEEYYGELEDAHRAQLRWHLQSCHECATQASDLQRLLDSVSEIREGEPEHEFWESSWDKLQSELGPRGVRPRWSEWALRIAAGIVLIGLGLGMGLYWGQEDPTSSDPARMLSAASNPSLDPELVGRVNRHLRKSKLVLLGIVNLDPSMTDFQEIDLEYEKVLSGELALESQMLQVALADSSDQRTSQLLSDLEVILLQIANLHAVRDAEGVELVKMGVDQRSILFRIRLAEIFKSRGRTVITPQSELILSPRPLHI